MPWGKIDDSMYDHPKVERVSLASLGLWLKMFSWSCKHKTTGEVPTNKVLGFAEGQEVLIQQLLDVKLLEPSSGGFKIHDYEVYNYDHKARQERLAERAQKGASARWKK
jgi:hypothetical protein